MYRWFFRWLVTALAIFLVPHLVPGVQVPGFGAALAMSAVLALLNLLVKPVLVLLTLPLTLFSLGFFYLVINALLFTWAGSLVRGVEVASFRDAFFASLVVSAVSWLVNGRARVRRTRVVWTTSGRPKPGGRPPGDEETIELHESESGKWE